jgi:hypothetical protein
MLKELGEYKEKLVHLFSSDEELCRLLAGDGASAGTDSLIVMHPYIGPFVDSPASCLFVETQIPKASQTIKDMKITIQAVCHKDALACLENEEKTAGLRHDRLAARIETILCETRSNAVSFGIGRIALISVEPFLADPYIGHTLIFTVPAFR